MPDKKRESFLMYKSFYEPIKQLSTEGKGMLLVAVFEYQINGIEIDLPPDVRMCFAFLKNQFRLDNIKFDKTSEKRAEFGKKGGIAKASKSYQSIANDSKPSYNENENENENEKDNDTVNKNTVGGIKQIPPPTNNQEKKIIDWWNGIAKNFGLNSISAVDEHRWQYVRKCCELVGSKFKDVSAKLEERFVSNFTSNKIMFGKNKINWKISFDWLFKDSKNFLKVYEGNYTDEVENEN